jgi:hypothetical protein
MAEEMITRDQREALLAGMEDIGVAWAESRSRAVFLGQLLPGWAYGGDLGCLTRRQAGDLLEAIERRRLAR